MLSKRCPMLVVILSLLMAFQCCHHVCVCDNDAQRGVGVGGGRVSVVEIDEDDDNDLMVEVEEEEVEERDIFEPTHEWKTVEDGQMIPPGLHVRMNLETGKREAKLLSEEEPAPKPQPQSSEDTQTHTDSSSDRKPLKPPASQKPTSDKPEMDLNQGGFHFAGDQRRANHYGRSDRRGIINKRRQAFSQKEVADMLRRMEQDSIDFSKLPGLTQSHAIPEDFSFSQYTHQKAVDKRKQEDGDSANVLQKPLHRELAKMLEHSRTLARTSATVPELLHALEELEYHVHQIDNAKELNSIGGLVLVVRLLNHSHPEIRSYAAHVVGAATQSNPHVQMEALEYGALELLCKFIAAGEPDLVQRRGLFALSALMRGNTDPQLTFLQQCGGLGQLGQDFHQRSTQTQMKVVALLTDLLHEQHEDIHDSTELRDVLHRHIEEHQWCHHIPTLLHNTATAPIEKALQAMNVLQHTCDFTGHAPRLEELSQHFERALEAQKHVDDVAQNLLRNSRDLLEKIMMRKLKLKKLNKKEEL